MAATAVEFELRCHSCSHGVGSAAVAMRFVALFKASLFGRMPRAHASEIRKRCPHCGFVTVFHPEGRVLTIRKEPRTVQLEAGRAL